LIPTSTQHQQFEVGAKQSLIGNRLFATLALYQLMNFRAARGEASL